MTPHRAVLLQARKAYSRCAQRIEAKIKLVGLSQQRSDQIIGVGVAADWVRRAAEMDDISFMGKQLDDSPRKPSFVELLRYNFSWFGLNAIFAREELLNLIGRPVKKKSEFEAFRVLYHSAQLHNEQALLTSLVAVLATPTSPRLPNAAAGTAVSTLNAIYTKYLSHHTGGQAAKTIATAAAGNLSVLDMPTLLYALRNWSVHGNALEGSFGTRPGFLNYVVTLEGVLAEVHLQTATKLLKVL